MFEITSCLKTSFLHIRLIQIKEYFLVNSLIQIHFVDDDLIFLLVKLLLFFCHVIPDRESNANYSHHHNNHNYHNPNIASFFGVLYFLYFSCWWSSISLLRTCRCCFSRCCNCS
uniref:Candidate secreted effector n=1 Tax=Meloidogyne incognita TaxID=6306 RepID=A0A914KZJ7_MELIC